MPSFGPRNVFYLRINAHTVLPVFLHLDERNGHSEWMTEAILQQVIEDLRPLIGPKIRAEDAAASTPGPAAKKTSGVDVYRGSTYQFGYYLQKAEHHSLLIKSRHFAPMDKEALQQPPLSPDTRPQPTPTPDPSRPHPYRRSGANVARPKRGVKRRRVATSDEEELSDRESGQEDQLPPNDVVNSIPTRRSQRSRRPAHTYTEPDDDPMGDVDMDEGDDGDSSLPAPHQTPLFLEEDNDSAIHIAKAEPTDDGPLTAAQPNTATDPFVIDEDDDTDAKKMQLNIRYEGFSITSWRLCLIVQPYPPLPRSTSTSATSSLLRARQSSIVQFVRNGTEAPDGRPRLGSTPLFREPTPIVRDRTPLFREPTPLFREPRPYEGNGGPDIHAVPLGDPGLEQMYNDDDEPADESLDRFKQFTQSFTQANVDGIGATGEDADADEDGFFMGDADERND